MNTKAKGFTLIELLVVVAIIGILATVVLASLSSARSNARDARRESDIKTIQNALELYYIDNGVYPTYGNWVNSNNHENPTWNASLETSLGVTLPRDPLNETGGHANQGFFTYTYGGFDNAQYCNGNAYILMYNKENSDRIRPNDVVFCDGTTRSTSSFIVGMSPAQ